MTVGLLTVLRSSDNGSLFCKSVECGCAKLLLNTVGDSSMPTSRTTQVAVSWFNIHTTGCTVCSVNFCCPMHEPNILTALSVSKVFVKR